MTASLAGKVAIATGGASGLGRGIVERLVDAGPEVVIADLNDHDGDQLASDCGSRAWFRHVDVAVVEDVRGVVQAAANRFGRLDVMLNNRGISSSMHRSFLDDDLAHFSKVMSVNVLGVMRVPGRPHIIRPPMTAAASSTSRRSVGCKPVAGS